MSAQWLACVLYVGIVWDRCVYDVSVPERSKGVNSRSTVLALWGQIPPLTLHFLKPLKSWLIAVNACSDMSGPFTLSLMRTHSLLDTTRCHVLAALLFSCPMRH